MCNIIFEVLNFFTCIPDNSHRCSLSSGRNMGKLDIQVNSGNGYLERSIAADQLLCQGFQTYCCLMTKLQRFQICVLIIPYCLSNSCCPL